MLPSWLPQELQYVLALVNIGCVTEAVCGPSMAQLNLFTVTNSPNTRIMAALTERGMMSWLSLQWFCRLLEGRMTSGKSMWKKITLIHFKFMFTSHQGFFLLLQSTVVKPSCSHFQQTFQRLGRSRILFTAGVLLHWDEPSESNRQITIKILFISKSSLFFGL